MKCYSTISVLPLERFGATRVYRISLVQKGFIDKLNLVVVLGRRSFYANV
jgi:hypothetical protein